MFVSIFMQHTLDITSQHSAQEVISLLPRLHADFSAFGLKFLSSIMNSDKNRFPLLISLASTGGFFPFSSRFLGRKSINRE
jgi:hypothetical protein